jgi:hypothetical protein
MNRAPNPSPERDAASDSIRNMHDVFSDWSRRAVLYYLQDSDGPIQVSTLADRLTDRRDPETRVASLRAHVDAMAAFGIVRYDRATDTVRLSESVTVSVDPPWGSAVDRPEDGG